MTAPRDPLRFGLSAAFALFAFGISALLLLHREAVFEYSWKPGTDFRADADPTLESAALGLLEKAHPGETCVSDWVGKDDSFVYLTAGCALFSRNAAGEVAAKGDDSYRPYRVRYHGSEVSAPEVVDAYYFENSLRRLFPRPAAELVRVRLNRDLFRQRGIKKAEGK